MLVSFYILQEASNQASWLFACHLIEKNYAEKKDIYVHTKEKADAEHLDALLWTYKDTSFLPHELYDPVNQAPLPLQIGFKEPPPFKDLFINVSNTLMPFYKQFSHTIEIVFSDTHVQQLARERFKYYRDQGCKINTYKLKADEL